MRAIKGLRMGAAATTIAVGMQLFGSLALGPGADAMNGLVQATTRVHVRTQPTTASSSLAILSPGQRVTATGDAGGWTRIAWKGRTAYVYSKYLTSTGSSAPVSTAPAGKAYTTANLNVRTGPSTNYRRVALAPKGRVLNLTGRVSGSFTQITWDGSPRWVATRYISRSAPSANPPSTKSSVQTTENLNIRTGPSTSHARVATAPKGTILAATGRKQGSFTEVVWQGNTRWAASSWLRPVGSSAGTAPAPSLPSTTTRWATANLNIWYASSGSRYSGEIAKGSQINVTGRIAGGRAEIVHNGALRWVTARYTTATSPGTSGPINSTPGKWDLNSPPITGGPRGTALNKGYSSGMHRTNPYIQRISADAWARFPEIKTHYGWRRDVTPDHPAGRAVDLMIPNYKHNKALGWAAANYYRKHAKTLNISYIIFDQKIWSVARDSEGWRRMANRGGDTANHLDHVHINSH